MNDNRLVSQNRKKYVMVPYFVFAAYILGTLLLNLFGPIEYEFYTFERKLAVTLYIIMFLMATYVGMKTAALSADVSDRARSANCINVKYFVTVIQILIVLVFFIKLFLVIYSYMVNAISFSGIGFAAIAEIYTTLHRTSSDYNIARKIDSFTKVLTYLSFFSGMYLWKRINWKYRILVCVSIILELGYNVFFVGTQRSLFTYFLLGGLLYVVHIINNNRRIKTRNLLIAALIIVIAVAIFANMINARYTLWGSVMSSNFRNGMRYHPEHILVRWLPEGIKYAFISLLSYPSQGYYGLALNFETPFQWTFFLGSVRGLNSIVSQVFSIVPDFLANTYPVRTGELMGFDGLAQWHTIFPWLASDVTYMGALVVMMFIAYLFIRCWKEVILYQNPLSFAMVIQLTILYVFVPANNQLFIDRGDSLGMVMLFIIWILFHGRLNYYYEKGVKV